MKQNLLFLSIFLANITYSQVGIGTSEPKVTLHIEADSENINAKDGFLLPKIEANKLKLKNYDISNTGTLVYITSLPSGDNSNNLVEYITEEGIHELKWLNSGKLRWIKLAANGYDLTDDAWVNQNGFVRLGTKSDGTTSREETEKVSVADGGYLGLGVNSPGMGIHLLGINDQYKDDIVIEGYHTTPGPNLLFMSGKSNANNQKLNLDAEDTIGEINFLARVNNDFNETHARIYTKYKGNNKAEMILSVNGKYSSSLIIDQFENVGINTNPRTKLDIKGAIAIHEKYEEAINNNVEIGDNQSHIVIWANSGQVTDTINITFTGTPVTGQRLVIVNATNDNYNALFYGTTIPHETAREFVYSAGKWRPLQ